MICNEECFKCKYSDCINNSIKTAYSGSQKPTHNTDVPTSVLKTRLRVQRYYYRNRENIIAKKKRKALEKRGESTC